MSWLIAIIIFLLVLGVTFESVYGLAILPTDNRMPTENVEAASLILLGLALGAVGLWRRRQT
ncbi:MAG TPA: hypothetical protein VN285_00635 [Candidatus Deferrimicrobium sp.]|nr:hypothetical protein [Candidatus Deferrimicrobium sp.]